MRYFLLDYDRPRGKLLSITEHDTPPYDQYFELERTHRVAIAAGERLVTMLDAPSVDHLRVTHGRFFS